jgi:hypothetical protein
MPILTDDMKRVVNDQRLGFVATVGADGTPNLSPKGTTMTWGDALVFADIRSPQTIRNLLANSSIEINVVDPIVRKGYRFKGRARILVGGPTFDAIAAAYRDRGVRSEFEHLVIVNVERALPVTSPAYDTGASEAEVRRAWEERRR